MRCDSHVHIVGPAQKYPQVPERTHLAGVASVETLRRLGEKRGISRFVIVQPSFYGTDNSAALDALMNWRGGGGASPSSIPGRRRPTRSPLITGAVCAVCASISTAR